MREIKFRAWDIRHKLMYIDIQNEDNFKQGNENCFGNYLKYGPYEIMQYTGLKDKNGKEIYEGDVCNYDNGVCDEYTQHIVFKNHVISFDEYGLKFGNVRFIHLSNSGSKSALQNSIEIIGNIYENPELLKGSHD